jgi:hypothetical protein
VQDLEDPVALRLGKAENAEREAARQQESLDVLAHGSSPDRRANSAFRSFGPRRPKVRKQAVNLGKEALPEVSA